MCKSIKNNCEKRRRDILAKHVTHVVTCPVTTRLHQITVNSVVECRFGPLSRYLQYRFTPFADCELLTLHGAA